MNILLVYLLLACVQIVKSIGEAIDDRTLLFIQRGGQTISVRELPDLLLKEGNESTDPSIVAFLKNASNVETLGSVLIELVKTSRNTVSCDKLCEFVANASTILPDLEVGCSANAAGEVTRGGTKTTPKPDHMDPDLHVNDPDAKELTYFKSMRMGEVWKLLDQYALCIVPVAVIDSGINFTDKDLGPMKTTFRDSSGTVFDGAWSFLTNSPKQNLSLQHGTYIARVLAAKANNSYGMVGVAPNARLVSLEIMGNDLWSVADFVRAINMAVDAGMPIISISLSYNITGEPTGRGSAKLILRRALQKAKDRGIFVVSCAGNKGVDAADNVLCSHGSAYGICVGALNKTGNNTLVDWSNYGPEVDIAAFGEDMHVAPNTRREGTSFSVPLVSGTVAILLGLGVEPQKIRRLLMHNATPLSDGSRKINRRSGALDVWKTVNRALVESRMPT